MRISSAVVLGLGVLVGSASLPAAAKDATLEVLVSGTAHEALFAMDFDGDRGIAVGARGDIQTTTDGGKTWAKSKIDTELALLGVHLDSSRAIAVGQTGALFLKSADSAWQKVDSNTTKRLFAVRSSAEGVAVAVGEFGAIQLSQDGGKTWHSLAIDWALMGTDGGAEPHLYGVDIAADGAISAVGEFGLVIRSTDGGRSWKRHNFGTASLFAIEIREDGVGYAVGQDGYALKTSDRGLTWQCIDVGSKAILNGVSSTPDGKVGISAMREMMTSQDDGVTWVAVEHPEIETIWYVGIAMRDFGVLAAGQAGRIVRVGS